MTPCDQHVTQTVGLLQRQAEDRHNKSRNRAGDESEQREHQQTAIAVCEARGVIQVVSHCARLATGSRCFSVSMIASPSR